MKLFGTDGIRGKAGTAPLEPKTVARVGAAIVKAMRASVRRLTLGPGVCASVIRRDTRESGTWIEDELARGLTVKAPRWSAPAWCRRLRWHLARTEGFDAGIVISASHNPYEDNGIKVFGGSGTKLTEQLEASVERLVADSSWSVPDTPGRIERRDLSAHYVEHLDLIMKTAGPLAGSHIVIDCANGATAGIAPPLFEALGFQVEAIGVSPDGRNINLDCGSTHLDKLSAAVVTGKARLGVAFDGDGDRALFVDHDGRVVDGDAILLMAAIT